MLELSVMFTLCSIHKWLRHSELLFFSRETEIWSMSACSEVDSLLHNCHNCSTVLQVLSVFTFNFSLLCADVIVILY